MKKYIIILATALALLTGIGIYKINTTEKTKAASTEEERVITFIWQPNPIYSNGSNSSIEYALNEYTITMQYPTRGTLPTATVSRLTNSANPTPNFQYDQSFNVPFNGTNRVLISVDYAVSNYVFNSVPLSISTVQTVIQTIEGANTYTGNVIWTGVVSYIGAWFESIRIVGLGENNEQVYAEIIYIENETGTNPYVRPNRIAWRQNLNESGIGQNELNNFWQAGYDEGYAKGFETGETKGFAEGEIAGAANANSYTFLGLMNAVFYAPLKAITSMLNFEILGVNLLSLATGILTLAGVIALIKAVI